MLTRRQARLLGLTSGEDGGASGSSTSSVPPSPTGVAASGLPRVSGYSIACEAISATSAKPGDPPRFIRRLSSAATSSSSASTAARGYRRNSFFEPSASASKAALHVKGGSGGDGGGGRARLGARHTDALLSKAQAAIDYWAAASTTAGPSICFARDSTSPWRALHVPSPKAAVHVTASFGATAKSAEGSSLAGCSARLTAAQLRARWRGVTRNCSFLHASTRATANGGGAPRASVNSVNFVHTAQLPIAARPASTPPSTEFVIEAQAGIATSGGDSTGVAQQTDRALAPLNVASRRSLALFTSPFYADVAAPTLSASAAALGATEAATLLPALHQIPTQRAAITALALRQRKEDVRAQRQRRICHEVHNQAYVKAHEARMRLLFGLSGTDSNAATTAPSGALAQGHSVAPSAPSKAALGEDHIAAGEEAYLQSLNPSKSDEEAKVLRVVASIDAALRQHLASAYTDASQPTFPSESSSANQRVRAADALADDHHLTDGFAARRPAILEAAIADATQRVESFTGQLLPYQQEGVRWLLRLNVVEHMNGILADDMGLGKTAQTVVYLSCYKDMVEMVVQGLLEELEQRHARLCQGALGLTATTAGSGALARESGSVEEGEMPPWLTWCAEAAAQGEYTSRRTEGRPQRSSSTIQPLMRGVTHGDSIAASAPLAATVEPASPAATPELAAARACGGFIKLVKQVKQWLWQLEEGRGEGVVHAGSCGRANGVPWQSLAGHKRRLREDEEREETRASATAGVAAALPAKRRRGRPPKNLSATMAVAAAAAAQTVVPRTPMQIGRADIAQMVASHTRVPAFSLPMNRQLEREFRTFRPVLIIAPLSTLPHWAGEFQRFSRRHTAAAVSPCPGSVDAAERFTVYVLNGPRSERESRMGEFLAHVERLTQQPPTPGGASGATPATPVVVIPHDMLTKPLSGALRQIRHVDWHVVAIDEAQRIKCARSVLFKKVCELHSVSRLVLTGTPLQNNTTELFSLLRFLTPHTFVSSELFEQLDSALLAASRSSALEDRELHILLCRRVHRLLMPFILRRERSILKTALPPIRDYAVLCPLLPFQSAQLKEVERKHHAGTLSGNPHIQYRKILLHPYTTQSFFYVDEEVVRTSGKLLVLDFMMRFLQRTQHKFLVFCGWTLVLDIVETLCGMRGIPYVRLDGRTTVKQREANIRGFNRSVASGNGVVGEAGGGGGDAEGNAATSRPRRNSRQRASTDTTGGPSPNADGRGDEEDGSSLPLAAPCCFLISKVAGGVGLNLQAADTVFLLDVDYNPQRDAQALSRVYRVGQTKEVRVFRLIIDHAIEQDIVAIHEAKDDLGRAVVQAGCYDLHSSVHEREAALQGIFRAGALSRLSQQWATTTRTADGAQGDSGEEREEAVPSPCASFPPMPFRRCDLKDEGGADGDAEEVSEASPSPAQTPTDLHRVFISGGSGGVRAMSSAPRKQVKTEMANEGGGRLADAADGGISATVAGDVDPQCALLPHRRRRRHITFKLEKDDSEEGGGRADRGDPAADPAGNAKTLAHPATAPLLFTATSPHPSMTAAEVGEAVAAATARVLAPAEHLLAMRERLEEVLLRHEGERHVLEDMFGSV